MKAVAGLLLLVAACSQQDAAPSANQADPAAGSAARAAALPAARPFAVKLHNDLFEFDFTWPAEAAAVPQLAQSLRAEMEKSKAELIAGAKEDKAYRDKQGFDFQPHSASTSYETAGQSPRLLSLRADAGGYSGGAHGNFGTGALLWDRRAGKEIAFADLFAARGNRDRLLTQGWCDVLNKARAEKRGEPVAGGGLFDDCPPLDDIAVIPVDSNKDGKFDRLLLVASPYVAGPWVEGSYEIELPLTADLIAALKSEYRPSFTA